MLQLWVLIIMSAYRQCILLSSIIKAKQVPPFKQPMLSISCWVHGRRCVLDLMTSAIVVPDEVADWYRWLPRMTGDIPCKMRHSEQNQKLKSEIFNNLIVNICDNCLIYFHEFYNIPCYVSMNYDTHSMWRNPCTWSSKSCQLHVDFTFQMWCWPQV